MDPTLIAWMDGEERPVKQLQTPVFGHTLHYGLGAFEGIRAYGTKTDALIFRLDAHIDRLYRSCQIVRMPVPVAKDNLVAAIERVLQANRLTSAYIRPVVWRGGLDLGVLPKDQPVHVAVAAWPWEGYLGAAGTTEGIACTFSSHRRVPADSGLEKAKLCGQYVLSVLAKQEAAARGVQEAILLDHQGQVAEGSSENIFLVRDNELWTPPESAPILAGITRDAIIHLARAEGFTVREEGFSPAMLLAGDEVFFTGTAAEVTPVVAVDGLSIGSGSPGPVTRALQAAFANAQHGEHPKFSEWVHRVHISAEADAPTRINSMQRRVNAPDRAE